MPYVDAEARREYHKRYNQLNGHKYSERARVRFEERKKEDPAHYMLQGAKSRARRKGLDFDISKEDILIPTHCPVLGMELVFNKGGFKDNSPSLDRIDSAKGYIKGNIQVMSYKANAMKNNATFEEVEKLYLFMKPSTYEAPNMRGL